MGDYFAKALNNMASMVYEKKIRIVMVGLDNAGKTTVLYALRRGQVICNDPLNWLSHHPPTFETVEYKNMELNAWDLDVWEPDKMRPIYEHYYKNTDGLIFIVDSNDHKRLRHSVFYNSYKMNLLTFGYISECIPSLNLSHIIPLSLYSIICEYAREMYDKNDYNAACTAKRELDLLLLKDELKGIPLLVFANKKDLPNALSVNEVTERLELNKILQSDRKWHIQSSDAIRGDGLYEGYQWISDAIK